MCHHINPCSVNSYLSGISQQLKTHFPSVKEVQNSILICHTLQGCMRVRGTATVHKCALTVDDLQLIVNHYHNSTLHDNRLFIAMLITGFFGLLHLGEMTFLDETSLQNRKKVTRQSTVNIQEGLYDFILPGHKADHFFEGNKIIISAHHFNHHPLCHFEAYIAS